MKILMILMMWMTMILKWNINENNEMIMIMRNDNEKQWWNIIINDINDINNND